jgi:hypothetical protein
MVFVTRSEPGRPISKTVKFAASHGLTFLRRSCWECGTAVQPNLSRPSVESLSACVCGKMIRTREEMTLEVVNILMFEDEEDRYQKPLRRCNVNSFEVDLLRP